MNLEFLKSKNSKIVLGVLAVLIVAIIIIVIVSNGSNNEGKLLLTCNGEREIENTLSAEQTITFNKTNNGIKMLLNNKMTMKGNLVNYSKAIYDSVVKRIDQQYEYLSRVDYINYDASYNDDYVVFNLEYDITPETNEQITAEYNYDFLNNSIDEIKSHLEGEGYKCQNS